MARAISTVDQKNRSRVVRRRESGAEEGDRGERSILIYPLTIYYGSGTLQENTHEKWQHWYVGGEEIGLFLTAINREDVTVDWCGHGRS